MSKVQPGLARLVCGLLVAVGLGVGGTSSAQESGDLAAGRVIIVENCGSCHAVDKNDKAQHPQAPNLRDLSKNYPVSQLAEALAEGIMTGHPDMPVFEFEPDSIDSIIAYLESIQVR